jgi:hypothetical protein
MQFFILQPLLIFMESIMEHSIVVQESNSAEEFSNVVANLKKRYKQVTPKKFKKTRQGKGGKEFTYVDRRYVEQWLNENYADRWSFEIVPNSHTTIGDNVHVLGTLVLQEQSGTIRKFTCYGAKEAIPSNGHLAVHPYLKSAESDALKRCAIADPDVIAWFARCMPILVEQFPPNKLFNLPKQFAALSEGKLTKDQILQNYAKLNITLEP